MITDKQKTKKDRWKNRDSAAARSLISCPHCSSRKFAFLINKKESGKSVPEVLADENGNARAACVKCRKEFAVRLNKEEKKLEAVEKCVI